ncbi:hypothetical protein SAMN06265337_0170 [Hymenobacter gelipurpurascens]|uniref:Uncharacterized protein n=1 Tax=Hymenobacter gelipurpurascens TaxID=89968 RepID=A0A212T1W2_9BACT|nr:hypothetical protein [Hymenobacter gelipurpurascens]SNC60005.1 hypothetical protein SAMN06265337_0170 [Hymenobacter gelipurpurascens]
MVLNRYITVFLVLAGLAGCTGAQSSASEVINPTSKESTSVVAVAVDVPQLVGHSIDEVRKVLGPAREKSSATIGLEPTPAQMKATKGEDWINTFEQGGQTLVVTFNARTRTVRDIVLIGSDEDYLLRAGNLNLTASNYIVLPVPNPKDTREVVGLRVISRK